MDDSSGISIPSTLDQLFEKLPIGSVKKAMGNNLYGINFRQTASLEARNKDSQGFVFFTRPQLNLDLYNIVNYRGFYNLLNDVPASYQRFTRLTLDPRLANNGAGKNESIGLQNVKGGGPTVLDSGLTSPFVDPKNIFIPTLTNHVNSLSGWPDITAPTYTSSAGVYGEEHAMVDGVVNNYESFDLDVSFQNTRGSPLIYFFYVWVKYQTLVYEGVLDPYMDFILENELDYCTRVYRILLDQRKKYVTYAGCTGASFPLNVPTGAIFDFNRDTPFSNHNSEINIRFKSMGFVSFEDIVKYWFNSAVAIGNPAMRSLLEKDTSGSGEQVLRENDRILHSHNGMTKIPNTFALGMDNLDSPFFSLNYRAYPWINLSTNEMEWWVDEKRLSNASAAAMLKTNSRNETSLSGNGVAAAKDIEAANAAAASKDPTFDPAKAGGTYAD
jgi:hypothetical protein